jgi:hypothetical protein
MPGGEAETIVTSCPHCGKSFAVAAVHAGKRARCPACGQAFVIEPRPAAGATAVAAATPPVTPPPVPAAPVERPCCPICQSPLAPGEAAVDCPSCKSRYHEECWSYNGGCGAYGCEQAPPTERLTSLEIPASHWGCEDKPCPSCGLAIMAAAVRCRHCGATFTSAAPEEAAAYHREQALRAKLPGVRTTGIWLLAFSLIPCTAPFAAIIGLIWYFSHRQAIRALPPLYAAVCTIAVGIACAQSGLLIVCGVLASMARGALP